MVDFAELKARVPIVDVLGMLQLNLTPQGEQLRGTCPISQSTQARAFIVTPAKNAWICFCSECKKLPKQGGDCIELVSRLKRVGPRDAAQLIADHFKVNGGGKPADNAPAASEGPQERKPAGFDPLAYQRSLDPAHVALKDCGVPEATIRDFDGGYCGKGLNRGRLTLPVHDAKEELLAFMGLALKGEQPDIQYPKDFVPPPFFNLHRVADGGTLFLVQTPRDVLRAWDNNLTDVVCPLLPLTLASLEFLTAFMREKEIAELEFY
ncbi:MAG: hypothetical protein BGO51_15515 [Rhodospirillales bacterium 69-11]|nr:MAG: hypothetical protein BGO51_15515 [Rhodospirillales bacterium 69-11]